MKKRIKVLILAIVLMCVAMFSGCNRQVGDLNYKFTNAYVKIGEDWVDVEIKTWKDYEGEQIQLKLADGTVMVVHAANCILYKGELPKQGATK